MSNEPTTADVMMEIESEVTKIEPKGTESEKSTFEGQKTADKGNNTASKPTIPKKLKRVKVETTSGGTQKAGTQKSAIWDHFTRNNDPNNPRASCNYCGQSYVIHPKKSGTTNLWTHLDQICKKYPHRNVDKTQRTLSYKPVEGKGGEASGGFLEVAKYDAEECRRELARMIITDELPFRVVEGVGFRRLLRALQPRFDIPSRITVARDCMKLFHEEKLKLKKILKDQRVCLTTDTWTSIQNFNYMCLTAHWIDDDWKLKKRIINFCQVPNHKGTTIGKTVELCVLDWGITKLLTLTVDNASSNDLAIKYLKTKTRDWRHTIFDHDYLHVRCSAHILNLVVKEGLSEHSIAVERVRNAIRYVRSSPARLQYFKKAVELSRVGSQSLVCLDVETRWNSTYFMLESAGKFSKAFERLEEVDPKFLSYFDGDKIRGPPNAKDWSAVACLVSFLKIFYHATLRFSGSLFVTSNTFFNEICGIHSKLIKMTKNPDEGLRKMAMKMKEKFDKYWNNFNNINVLLYVAVVLDPRFKLRYVKFCLDQIYEADLAKTMVELVESTFLRLFDHYNEMIVSYGISGEVSTSQKQTCVGDEEEEEEDSGQWLISKFNQFVQSEDTLESKSEAVHYLAEPIEHSDDKFDLLNWWKGKCVKYPVISCIARDVLAIPISTVSSESAFSTGGRILDPFRSSLAPQTVEALVCAQNWLRDADDNQAIEFREALDDVEKFEGFVKDVTGKDPITVEDE